MMNEDGILVVIQNYILDILIMMVKEYDPEKGMDNKFTQEIVLAV